MSTMEEEWFSAGIKNLGKKENKENKEIIKEFQLSKMCLHCVCSKRCNGVHDKEGIEYMPHHEISYAFRSFCRDPKKNCTEINEAIEKLENDPESILHKPNFPIVNTCVHNHIQKYCSNCKEGRSDTFMIGDDEFRYCWSKQIPGKNTIPIGIHWDVKMTVVDDQIRSYDIIPYSKEYIKEDDDSTYRSSNLSIQIQDTPHSGVTSVWTETPTTLGSKLRDTGNNDNKLMKPPRVNNKIAHDANYDKNLLMKENELLHKEIKLIERDYDHQLKDLTLKCDNMNNEMKYLSDENKMLKNKLCYQKEHLISEIKENSEIIEKAVVEQFLDTYY